ncbi:N-acetylmuramic acid 6-phosphate etherase [Agromyces intestinalis]|uniref:N-acetylmuramic acid 6-phosphate etherase n=1 Tax=Agromyces intestinalis TaxID=2592652 RepID=A0A5C1YFX4_9MICO|nr:N-acetylmuramic acid 6-phosphate etherase [Agromyces intestinalis]QEO14951.1 N-acetylmuramic acid 6-phosphate etherase [Agromyces intestinalis]
MPTHHDLLDRSEADRRLPPTEQRLDASAELDALPSLQVLRLLNAHDRIAVDAVEAVLPQLADLVDLAAERFRRGGDVHYFGAGTSGRLGVLDAAELRPTFNLEAGRVVGHIAGGETALVNAVEDAEDSEADGRAAAAAAVGAADVVIGLAASGNTPYVGGALAAARAAGAHTVLVSSNPDALLAPLADTNLVLETGAEVLTGSTRLKAATAEKLVLNGFSTALMIAVGRTWSNLMVSVVATNAKLRDRTVRILQEAADVDEPTARTLLDAADGELKTAIVAALGGVDAPRARTLLAEHDGAVRAALAALEAAPTAAN